VTPDDIKQNKNDGDIIITNINSKKINHINALKEFLNNTCDRTNLFIEAIDLNLPFPRTNIYPIDFGDLNEISEFILDENNGNWKNNKITLKSCFKNLRVSAPQKRNNDQFFKNFYNRMLTIRKLKVKSFNLSPI